MIHGVVRDGLETRKKVRDWSGIFPEVRVGSVDSRKGQGRVKGTSESPGRVKEPSWRSGMVRGTLGEDHDGSGTPPGGPEWVEGPSGRPGTGREKLGEVRDGSGNTWGGPGLVQGDSRRSGTGQGTIP